MKIAVPLAMVGAIVAEFIAAQRGLGNLILTTSQSLNMALNFAALILVTVWSSLLFQAFDAVSLKMPLFVNVPPLPERSRPIG